MKIDPSLLAPKENYALLITAIVPRPIAFVSTVGLDGILNVSPFSFFMGVTTDPPTVAISVGRRKGVMKDTGRNIADTGEFVVNVVDESVGEAMVKASGDWPPEKSEFEITGLSVTPSERIRAPRVKECKVSLECRERITLGVGRSKSSLILGEVLLIHVNDSVLKDNLIDPALLRAVGRLGGSNYCRTRDIFEMVRPRVDRRPASREG